MAVKPSVPQHTDNETIITVYGDGTTWQMKEPAMIAALATSEWLLGNANKANSVPANTPRAAAGHWSVMITRAVFIRAAVVSSTGSSYV